MANTAALLGNLLCTNADINYYTQQLVYWSAKYEANHTKLEAQVRYETQWESQFDKAIDNDKELSCGNVTVHANNQDEGLADLYAHEKVDEYNEELSIELADLDMEYETIKLMLETKLEVLRAQEESEKSATSNAAQDTGLLQS